MILALPERDQRRPQWQSLAGLLVSAADAGHPALTSIVTDRLERALSEPPFTSARLADVMGKKPPAPSLRRRKARLGDDMAMCAPIRTVFEKPDPGFHRGTRRDNLTLHLLLMRR